MEQQLILEEPDSQSEKHWKEKVVALKSESGYSEKWKWLLWTMKVTSVKSESDFCEKEKVISVKNRKSLFDLQTSFLFKIIAKFWEVKINF